MVKRLNIFTLRIEQDEMPTLEASNQYHVRSLTRAIKQRKRHQIEDINLCRCLDTVYGKILRDLLKVINELSNVTKSIFNNQVFFSSLVMENPKIK